MSCLLSLAFFVLRCAANPGIPASNATVEVKAFNVANFTASSAQIVLQPILPGHEALHIPLHAFLVEHSASKTRFMFDLGMRKDPLNFAPSISTMFANGMYSFEPFKDITELLEDGEIPLESIHIVIWSHSHFDHIGDMSLFPNSTDLVIGPGTNRSLYPEYPDAALQSSDFSYVPWSVPVRAPFCIHFFSGRKVIELNFNDTNLSFSGLPVLDYFGDGSFYLLNTPGHLTGHITALARVTPSSFVVLGGDTCHHAGQMRPRTYPCPAQLLPQSKTAVSTDYFWSPDSRVGDFDIRSRSQPLLSVPDKPDSIDTDPVIARVSLDKLSSFDANADFFVIVAHDISLLDVMPYFPASLNAWRRNAVKDRAVWRFLDDRNPAFRLNA
ncbi:hypothetical protein C8R43DRAFT_1060645 [Mycena crocata]|nr:hypothetical protein C8R43DRAFT_1060645 [Mycena crocata]